MHDSTLFCTRCDVNILIQFHVIKIMSNYLYVIKIVDLRVDFIFTIIMKIIYVTSKQYELHILACFIGKVFKIINRLIFTLI